MCRFFFLARMKAGSHFQLGKIEGVVADHLPIDAFDGIENNTV